MDEKQTTWAKVAGFVGNTIIFLTFFRVLLGTTIAAENILWGMVAVAVIIGLVVYWESKVPSKGVARLKRGGLVFLTTIVIDLIIYALV